MKNLCVLMLLVSMTVAALASESEPMGKCWRDCKKTCIPRVKSLEPCVDDCKANRCIHIEVFEEAEHPKRRCNAICRKVCAEEHLPKPEECLTCFKGCKAVFIICKDANCKDECPKGVFKKSGEKLDSCKTCLHANCGGYNQ